MESVNKIQLETVLPKEIEKRSFEIISDELGDITLDPLQAPIIKRVIHTTADFEYVKNLCFSMDAVIKLQVALTGTCKTWRRSVLFYGRWGCGSSSKEQWKYQSSSKYG